MPIMTLTRQTSPTGCVSHFIARVFIFASCGTIIGSPACFVKNLPKIKHNFKYTNHKICKTDVFVDFIREVVGL